MDYYKKTWLRLLQSRVDLRYHKVGQELLQSGAGNLQSGTVTTAKWERYYKLGNFFTTYDNFYKIGQYMNQSYINELVRKNHCPPPFL